MPERIDGEASEAAVHPWDEGAIEPSTTHIALSAAAGYLWLRLLPGSVAIPLGLIVVFFFLGRMTGANTFRGKVRFGRKALLAATAAAAVGYLAQAGLRLVAAGGSISIGFELF